MSNRTGYRICCNTCKGNPHFSRWNFCNLGKSVRLFSWRRVCFYISASVRFASRSNLRRPGQRLWCCLVSDGSLQPAHILPASEDLRNKRNKRWYHRHTWRHSTSRQSRDVPSPWWHVHMKGSGTTLCRRRSPPVALCVSGAEGRPLWRGRERAAWRDLQWRHRPVSQWEDRSKTYPPIRGCLMTSADWCWVYLHHWDLIIPVHSPHSTPRTVAGSD